MILTSSVSCFTGTMSRGQEKKTNETSAKLYLLRQSMFNYSTNGPLVFIVDEKVKILKEIMEVLVSEKP